MFNVRRELVWDYPIPSDPERDEAFVALYVGRVLDRGGADDVRALGTELIRKHIDAAPARREVLDFWRWWLERSQNGDPHRSAAAVPAGHGVGRSGPV
jgi:hypothetical protein